MRRDRAPPRGRSELPGHLPHPHHDPGEVSRPEEPWATPGGDGGRARDDRRGRTRLRRHPRPRRVARRRGGLRPRAALLRRGGGDRRLRRGPLASPRRARRAPRITPRRPPRPRDGRRRPPEAPARARGPRRDAPRRRRLFRVSPCRDGTHLHRPATRARGADETTRGDARDRRRVRLERGEGPRDTETSSRRRRRERRAGTETT